MKLVTCFLLLLLAFGSNAQLRYKYNNDKLDVPVWLTNQNYISENETEERKISIEEVELAKISSISVAKLSLSTTEHGKSSLSIYLGTFDKKRNMIDINKVAQLSSSDLNWQSELNFEEIEPHILKYYCVDLTYRHAENDKEGQNGMVISKADTITRYFKINTDGIIHFSDNLDRLKNVNEVSGQNSESENNKMDEGTLIAKIKQEFNDINENLNTYTKQEKNFNENIVLSYYFDGEVLKKIVESNVSKGQFLNYYYANNKLIFIFSYNKIKNTEGRYYFYNNQLIKWLKGKEKNEVTSDNDEYKEKEKELLARSDMFVKK